MGSAISSPGAGCRAGRTWGLPWGPARSADPDRTGEGEKPFGKIQRRKGSE